MTLNAFAAAAMLFGLGMIASGVVNAFGGEW